jgi:phosphohistidine swiveling domain-containing protein
MTNAPKIDIHAFNPMNEDPKDCIWERGNTSEARPGVATPLSANWWTQFSDASMLNMLYLFGKISKSERGARDGTGSPYMGWLSGYFYGRSAVNNHLLLRFHSRMPGADIDGMEKALMGVTSGFKFEKPSWRVQAVAGVKSYAASRLVTGWVRRRAPLTKKWWKESIAAMATADESYAMAKLIETIGRMRDDLTLQCTIAISHSVVVDNISKFVTPLSDSETALTIISGARNTTENAMLAQLWDIAHGAGDIDAFLLDYGYFSPNQGELAVKSWREDRQSLLAIIEDYKNVPVSDSPEQQIQRSHQAYQEAYQRLRAKLGLRQRRRFRNLCRLVQLSTITREAAKSMGLQCIDAARAAARRLSVCLAERGVVSDPEDIYFLTIEELQALRQGRNYQALIAERRALHRAYQEIDLPLTFKGEELRGLVEARTASREQPASQDLPLKGQGVSRGIAKGPARIITDPRKATIEPGEILVCVSTDPAWAPLLSLSSGVVLDTGGPLSHGAIVARELGVPCVANTMDATRRLKPGQIIEIDGTKGTVDIITA